MNKNKKIVVVGGGTGTFVVLSSLKKYLFDLTAITNVTDSGGSTGRLRKKFGFLPVGDFRQCLTALISNDQPKLLQKLLLYRFSKSRGLKGHNLGNLILTALIDITKNVPTALKLAAKIFKCKGNVLPISLDKVNLLAIYNDKKKLLGEHKIDIFNRHRW